MSRHYIIYRTVLSEASVWHIGYIICTETVTEQLTDQETETVDISICHIRDWRSVSCSLTGTAFIFYTETHPCTFWVRRSKWASQVVSQNFFKNKKLVRHRSNRIIWKHSSHKISGHLWHFCGNVKFESPLSPRWILQASVFRSRPSAVDLWLQTKLMSKPNLEQFLARFLRLWKVASLGETATANYVGLLT